MNKIKLKKVKDIIKRNDLIDKLYKELARLEIEEPQNTNAYEDIIELIKEEVKTNNKILYTLNLIDNDMDEIYYLIRELNHYNDDNCSDYINNEETTKIKRFMSHCKITTLKRHDMAYDIDKYEKKYITIQGNDYSISDGLNILRNAGHESTANIIEDMFIKANQEKCNHLIFLDNIALLHIELTDNIILNSLINRINNEKNINLKNELIKLKYQIIATEKNIESNFLNNYQDFIKTNYFSEQFVKSVKTNENIAASWNIMQKECINDTISNIYPREKNTYKSYKEIALDILLIMKVRTHCFLIINHDTFQEAINDISTAKNIAKTKLDSDIIDCIFNIKNDSELIKKLQK